MGKIDIELIEKLAEIMEKKGLSYLSVKEEETEISLSREFGTPAEAAVSANANVVSSAHKLAENETDYSFQPAPKEGEELKSPLVGVAYLSPAPGEEPFVTVGSMVKKGDQLCILEAMKVMNEFNAPRDGEIVEICILDGDTVEYGQALFRLK